MKTKLSILIALIALALTGWSQQLQQYKYGLFDNYFVNPAYVGTQNYYNLQIGHDTKFSGVSVSPRTYFVDLHSRVGRGYLFDKNGKINKFFSKFGNTAFGFQGIMYTFGPQYEYNFGVTYGYHLDLAPNLYTKLPRKLILAFTPRLFIMSFDRSRFTDNEGVPLTGFDDPIFPSNLDDNMFHMNFKFDVGALYQSSYFDIGISWLNFTNAHNGYENDNLVFGKVSTVVNDSVTTVSSGYNIYDSIYSSVIALNGKLKFLTLFESDKFDVGFIPNLTFFYRPNARDFEFNLDLRLDMNLYQIISSSRKELLYNIQGGTNIVYTRFYKDLVAIQPYVCFDFLDFKIQYTYQFPVNNIPGYWGRNQVSFVYALGRDKVFRASDRSSLPKRHK